MGEVIKIELFVSQDIVTVFNESENKKILLNKKNKRVYKINSDLFEMIETIYLNRGIERSEFLNIYSDVSKELNFLLDENIISSVKQKNKYNVKRIKKLNTARIFIECTNRCNLKCNHCYANFSNYNRDYLSLEIIKKLLRECVKLGVYEFDITGGEPMLHPDFKKILKLLDNYGMLTTIFSNLTITSDDNINLMKEVGIKTVITSIESYNDKIHDSYRGQDGALKKTISSINKLIKNDIEVKVNLVLGMHNINDIEKTIEFIKSFNIDCNIDITSSEGRAKNLEIKYEVLTKKIKELVDNKNEDYNINLSNGCGVGKRMLYVTSTGEITACPSLRDNDFRYGNIYDEFSLKNCFLNSFLYFTNKKYKKKCDSTICNGGCRARAFNENNDIMSEDILYCYLFKE
ncbi:MAG: radical SAM protein [Clostridiales bacterium]